MKKLYFPLGCILLVHFWATAADINQGEVVLPYTQFLQLLEAADKDAEELIKPPVNYIVKSVTYHLKGTDLDAVQLTATFEVVNLSKEWQQIFLMEASAAVSNVELAKAHLVCTSNGLYVLLEPDEDISISIELAHSPATPIRGGHRIADFIAIEAAQGKLEINHGSDPAMLAVTGAFPGDQEKSLFCLPAGGGRVQVKLFEAATFKPTRWRANSTHWIREADGFLAVTSHVRLLAGDTGRTSQARLHLNPQANIECIRAVQDDEACTHRLETTNDGISVVFDWNADEAIVREVLVDYTLPLALRNGHLSVPLVRVADAAEQHSTVYVSKFSDIAVDFNSDKWLDVEQLPGCLQASASREPLHYLSFKEAPKSIRLDAMIMPRVKTARAMVTQATYSTQVNTEGGIYHEASILVEHNEATQCTVRLPEGGKLLACAVNGAAAEPLLGAAGSLILQLPKQDNAHTDSKVEYIFTVKNSAMDPVTGKLALALPWTSLFIREIDWVVALPGDYRVTALEGNVVSGTSSKPGSIHLHKTICDGEVPVAALHYTRKDIL